MNKTCCQASFPSSFVARILRYICIIITWQKVHIANASELAERSLSIGWYRLIPQQHVFQTETVSNLVTCS